MSKICVIGAGTVGLSVATRLIDEFGSENVLVDIVAEKFYNETTSYGSGGLWVIIFNFLNGVTSNASRSLTLLLVLQTKKLIIGGSIVSIIS